MEPRRAAVLATSVLCGCLNLGIYSVWLWGSEELYPIGPSGNNLLSLLYSGMKSERRAPSPDVIVLSDNEQPVSPRVNGLPKETLQETSTEALMVSLIPMLGTISPCSIPQYS